MSLLNNPRFNVPASQHTLFIRGFPGDINLTTIRDFFAKEGGRCSFDFFKHSPDRTKLFVALRFDTKDIAKDILNKYHNSVVLGHQVQITWFKDIRRYAAYTGSVVPYANQRMMHNMRQPMSRSMMMARMRGGGNFGPRPRNYYPPQRDRPRYDSSSRHSYEDRSRSRSISRSRSRSLSRTRSRSISEPPDPRHSGSPRRRGKMAPSASEMQQQEQLSQLAGPGQAKRGEGSRSRSRSIEDDVRDVVAKNREKKRLTSSIGGVLPSGAAPAKPNAAGQDAAGLTPMDEAAALVEGKRKAHRRDEASSRQPSSSLRAVSPGRIPLPGNSQSFHAGSLPALSADGGVAMNVSGSVEEGEVVGESQADKWENKRFQMSLSAADAHDAYHASANSGLAAASSHGGRRVYVSKELLASVRRGGAQGASGPQQHEFEDDDRKKKNSQMLRALADRRSSQPHPQPQLPANFKPAHFVPVDDEQEELGSQRKFSAVSSENGSSLERSPMGELGNQEFGYASPSAAQSKQKHGQGSSKLSRDVLRHRGPGRPSKKRRHSKKKKRRRAASPSSSTGSNGSMPDEFRGVGVGERATSAGGSVEEGLMDFQSFSGRGLLKSSGSRLALSSFAQSVTKENERQRRLRTLSTEQQHRLQKKKEDLSTAYANDCNTFNTVVAMLVSKDPGLDSAINAALQESLKEIGKKFADELNEFIDALVNE